MFIEYLVYKTQIGKEKKGLSSDLSKVTWQKR